MQLDSGKRVLPREVMEEPRRKKLAVFRALFAASQIRISEGITCRLPRRETSATVISDGRRAPPSQYQRRAESNLTTGLTNVGSFYGDNSAPPAICIASAILPTS